MNHDFFQDGRHMLAKCNQVEENDLDREEDRATIGDFYNGRNTFSEAEAEEQGITEITNHLFGHDSMRSGAQQFESILTQGENFVTITVTEDTPEAAREGAILTKAFNKTVKSSPRFRPQWKSFAGELVLHGSSHFVFLDKTDWCPENRRPYAPDDSPTVPQDMDFWHTSHRMTLRELARRLDLVDQEDGWNKAGLMDAINSISGAAKDADGKVSYRSIDTSRPEELSLARLSGSMGSNLFEVSVPVKHVYQPVIRNGKEVIDLTIIADLDDEYLKYWSDTGRSHDPEVILADFEGYFRSASECFHTVFLDCNLGNVTRYHRSTGLGKLNYPSDSDVEEKFNSILEGAADAAREYFQAEDHGAIQKLDRYAGSNILPQGISFAQRSRTANYQQLMAPLQMLMRNSAQNSQGSLNNLDMGRSRELEVQAQQRVQLQSSSMSHRMNEVYDNVEGMAAEMVARIFAPGILPEETGWRDNQRARERAIRGGLKSSRIAQLLERDKFGDFKNIEVKISRHAGDGSNINQAQLRRGLMEFINEFSPEGRRRVIREYIIYVGNNPDLADYLLPETEELDATQVARAAIESEMALDRGLIGYIPPLRADDLHEIHAPEHLSALFAQLAKRDAGGPWGQVESAGCKSLIQHAQAHIEMLARRGHPKIKEFRNALVELSNKTTANDQQAQQAQQAQAEGAQKAAMEQARLQLEQRKQQSIEQARAVDDDRKLRSEVSRAAGKDAELALKQQSVQQRDRELSIKERKLAIEASKNTQDD